MYPVPLHRAVQDVLEGLIAGDVRVSDADVDDPERDTPGVFAEYVTDADDLAICCFASHALVNAVGAALIEVEPSVALESTGKSTLHEECVEGFREIVNVFASALNSDFTAHLRLRGLRVLPVDVTEELRDLWRRPRARRCYGVSLPDYGTGALILYAR